jgi:hypothetical protein
LALIIKQAVNHAAKGEFRPILAVTKLLEPLDKLIRLSVKTRERLSKMDISNMSLDEKMQKLKELITDSKPLDRF